MNDEKAESTSFKCEDCSRCFSMRMDYNRHRKMVHDKRFICTVCNQKYGLKTDLQRHQTTHQLRSEKTKHKCTFAGCNFKGASRSTYLKKHMVQKHHSADLAAFSEALVQSTKQFSHTSLKGKGTNFFQAVCEGREEEIEAFILEGVDISWVDPNRLTAGHIAIRHGQMNILKKLLQKGLRIWCPGYERSLLCESVLSGRLDIVKFLLEHGAANITEAVKSIALISAGQAGQMAIAQVLLDNGVRIDGYWYPWDFEKMHVEILRMNASHVLATDRIRNNTTLLHGVAVYYADMIGELLERGFDVDSKDRDGETPLWYALGYIGVVNEKAARILLDAGATISSKI